MVLYVWIKLHIGIKVYFVVMILSFDFNWVGFLVNGV